MRRTFCAVALSVVLMSLAGCSDQPAAINADSRPPAANVAAAPAPAVQKLTPQPKVTVPAGTKLRVALLEAVSSEKSRAGDLFLTSLTAPVIVNGKTVLAKGTKVRGRVVDAAGAGRVKGRAMLQLTLTQIVLDEENSVSISTKPYRVVAEPTKKRDATIIGGGAGIGAAIGAIAGGGKGAAIGAAVGGGAGTGTVLATKGKEIRYGAEHLLSFTLASSIEI